MKKWISAVLALTMLLVISCGCSDKTASASDPWLDESLSADMSESDEFFDELMPTGDSPSAYEYQPVASGTVVYKMNGAVVDASNTADGYIMCKYTADDGSKLKVRVTNPEGLKLDFDLAAGDKWETFPLSYGSGEYKVGVYKQKSGTKYSTLLSQSIAVQLTDEFAPFLRANEKAWFTPESKLVAKAAELCADCKTDLDKVAAVYDYVIGSISYDYDKAAQVKNGSLSGYTPDVDAILASGKGICSDYSALMTAMLRSQSVPTKVIYGYAGTVYHAWVSVYTQEYGWVEAAIYFDGKQWMRMDPTFAATANSSSKIMSYIGDGSNYTVKYMY